MDTIERIKQQISENTILLYMKGSPKLPSCGFSSQASQALISCEEKFAYVDTDYILNNIPEFNQAQDKLDEISNSQSLRSLVLVPFLLK